MKLKCQVCGGTSNSRQSPAICQYFCYWQLEGWLGWNGKRKVVVIRDRRAFRFVTSKISYPKMLAMARAFGWRGEENAGTMQPLEIPTS